MLVSYKYTYFVGTLLFLIYWFYFFIKFKNNRKQILMFSFLFALLGPISGVVWFTRDWWYPATILGYRTGIEDVLLGFSNGGMATVIFLFFYKELDQVKEKINFSKCLIPSILMLSVTIIFLVFTPLNSFYANCFGFAAALVYVLWRRPDLLHISFFSGMLMIIFSAPIYLLLLYLSPGWVEYTWMLDELSGVVIAGAPVEDLIWYFFVGASISTMYPYFFDVKYKFKLFSI